MAEVPGSVSASVLILWNQSLKFQHQQCESNVILNQFRSPLMLSSCFLEVHFHTMYQFLSLPHPHYMFKRNSDKRDVLTAFSLQVCLLSILKIPSQLQRSYNANERN
jgi:hypothetical protein